jgi:hypothetical protein
MKLILAWTWIGLVGSVFLGLTTFMLLQLPLEVWVLLGISMLIMAFFAITVWATNQVAEDIDDKDSAEKLGGK